MDEGKLRDNLQRVEARIRGASERAGRSQDVQIVAVTKGHPVSVVRAALAVGLRRIGENRVAELESKVDAIGRDAAEWHLIGHLQRNKVRRAVSWFDLIHSIDSLRLAQELSAEAERTGNTIRGLAQVNVSGEATKGGFEASDSFDGALTEIAQASALPGLEVRGLMTMAPYTSDESTLHRTFGRARELFDRCGEQVPGFKPVHLSMGMSNDYEVAVAEGSTMVRLGTVLFGERLT